jgi:hypothetical protein
VNLSLFLLSCTSHSIRGQQPATGPFLSGLPGEDCRAFVEVTEVTFGSLKVRSLFESDEDHDHRLLGRQSDRTSPCLGY